MVKAKRIIADSIKDHFLSQVSSKKTPKEMFNALSNLFEEKNINRRMALRNQLKGVEIQKGETMQPYFLEYLISKNNWKLLVTWWKKRNL